MRRIKAGVHLSAFLSLVAQVSVLLRINLPVTKALSLGVDQAGLVCPIPARYAVFCFIGRACRCSGNRIILWVGCLFYALSGFVLGFPAVLSESCVLSMGVGSSMISAVQYLWWSCPEAGHVS